MRAVLTELETEPNNAKVSGEAIGSLQLPKIHLWFTDDCFADLSEEQADQFIHSIQKTAGITAFFSPDESLCVSLTSEYVKTYGFSHSRLDFNMLSRRLNRRLQAHLQTVLKN